MMSRAVLSRNQHHIATFLVLSCLSLAGIATAGAQAEKRMKPLSAKEVAQVWVGLSEDELYLIRLRLDESGSGRAAYVFADQPSRLFTVQSWTYMGEHIEIVLENSDDSALPVPTLKGSLVGSEMKLKLSGEGWGRKVELRLEAALENRWQKLKNAMATQDP